MMTKSLPMQIMGNLSNSTVFLLKNFFTVCMVLAGRSALLMIEVLHGNNILRMMRLVALRVANFEIIIAYIFNLLFQVALTL